MFSDLQIDWIHLELTEKCNLKCPLCARTTYVKGNTDYYSKSLSLDQIKSYISKDFIRDSNLKYVLFCGSYGDPAMNQDLIPITDYFLKNSVDVSLATHGSLRSAKWWSQLGETFGKNFDVIFAIDGLEDTNSIYRVGASWKTIMRNCHSFIQSGGTAIWQFIPFRHNEHQIDSAKKIAKQMGFKKFVIRKSNRLMWKKNEEHKGLKDPKNPKLNIKDRNEKKLIIEKWIHDGQKPILPKCKSLYSKNHPLILRNDLNKKNIKITARGIVYPCGWLQPQSWYEDNGYRSEDFSLKKHSLKSILSNDFYNHGLKNMWQEGKIKVCVGFCSKEAVIEQEVINLNQ